jgi:PAS domain S-box-containing protein
LEVRNRPDVWTLVVLGVAGTCSLWIGSAPAQFLASAGSHRSHTGLRIPFDVAFLRRTGLIGGACLVVVVMSRLLYEDSVREQHRQRWVAHTYRVIGASQSLLSALQDAETGERGYLLTGDARYLEPFQSASAAADKAREMLRNLTAENPSQQARTAEVEAELDAELDTLAAKRFAVVDATVALRQAGRTVDAMSLVASGEGKRIMDRFRAVLAALQAEERGLLDRRTAEADLAAGKTRWVQGMGGGALLILLVVAGAMIERDILRRKQAHLALEESERATQSLLEAASLAVIGIDAAGRIVMVNAMTERIFGYRREELAGQPLELLVPEDLRARHQAHRTLYAAHPHTRPMGLGMMLSGRRKDGRLFPVEVSLSMVRIRTGPLCISFITDVTERTLAELERERILADLRAGEERLQRQNEGLEQRVLERTAQLEVANTGLESFAYAVAHDLRSPLRGIDGWSLALAEDAGPQLDDQARHHLGLIRSEAKRMGRLIDDLLRLARVTRAPLVRNVVDLTATARSIADNLTETHADRQIEFIIQQGLAVSGDTELLKIALTNLLDNAAKFTGKQPAARIEVGRTENGGQRAFYVRDNGAGFDMVYARLLFGPFQRLHHASEFPGNGIGLATVQRIVQRHGGRVWADAQVGRGATFFFTL